MEHQQNLPLIHYAMCASPTSHPLSWKIVWQLDKNRTRNIICTLEHCLALPSRYLKGRNCPWEMREEVTSCGTACWTCPNPQYLFYMQYRINSRERTCPNPQYLFYMQYRINSRETVHERWEKKSHHVVLHAEHVQIHNTCSTCSTASSQCFL